MTPDKNMEKSTEINGKIHSVGLRLLELFEAEASKVDPDMVAKFQKLPIEVRLRALLWATLQISQISGQNQAVFDLGVGCNA